MSRVGFIGAGRIGAPMVARLVGAGHQVRALGRSVEKSSALRELGATAVPTVGEAADTADVAIVCVFTDEQVVQVCLEGDLLTAMKPGSALIVHTTGSPRTAEAIAARANRHHIEVIDAPISGGPHNVADGQATLYVGGADFAVAHVRPVLASYGDPILHVGPLGAGQCVKLLNNLLFASQIGLVAEAVQLGSRLGVVEPTLLTALSYGSGTSNALAKIANAGSVAAFTGAVGDFIGKDIAVIRKTVAELGADMGRLDDIVNSGLPT